MKYPPTIQQLIDQLSELPTVGPKTAERYALWLLKKNPDWLESLANNLKILPANIIYCSECQALANSNPCPICADPNRDRSRLCLVSETKEMLLLEDSKAYNGLYYVLGGTLSAINNRGPESLKLQNLINRLKQNQNIKEIILALNPDFEGETTSLYLKKLLANFPVSISRLARGLPSGASLDYADQQTIANALKFRNKF